LFTLNRLKIMTASRKKYNSFLFSEKKRYDLVKAIYWRLPKLVRHLLERFKIKYISRHLLKRVAMATSTHQSIAENELPEWLEHMKLLGGMSAIIPCAFEFCELVNQRPINAAKYFSSRGYFVIFVAWQWSRGENLEKNSCQVWPGVFQVPLFEFIDYYENLPIRQQSALYIVSFPAPVLVDVVPGLRKKGYAIIYDIMDEWEEFSKVGQAIWYEKSVEESLVLQSDLVTAVAPSLVEKFTAIRRDIVLIGNGYSVDILGGNNRNISRNLFASGDSNNMAIGYFGHLTDAWFDWNLLFDLAENYPNAIFEIIGYGAPEWAVKKVADATNIKLLGKVVPADLHVFVREWDAAIIPFLQGKLAAAVDPIKIYEYIYFGLPVFVVGMPHLALYPDVVVSDQSNAVPGFEGFIELIRRKFAGDEAKHDEFLEKTTWDSRFDCLMKNIESKIILGDLYVV